MNAVIIDEIASPNEIARPNNGIFMSRDFVDDEEIPFCEINFTAEIPQ